MPAIQEWHVKEPYLDLKCGLGEGPYYEASRNQLRFVDIKKHRLHTVDLAIGPGSLKTLQLDMPIGVTADVAGLASNKYILIGGKHGLALLNRDTGKYEYLPGGRFYDSKERDERLRSNDGAVDPQGRFWIGTMNDFHVGEPQAEGSLFRYDARKAPTVERAMLKDGLTIPNSVSWSQDRKTAYLVHSSEKTVYKYDFDSETGDLSNERIFYKHDGDGEPDGHKTDEHGNIWQAVFNEGKVLRLNPDGQVTGIVHLPTRSTSCPCFVGTELFVTSAMEEEPEKYPESAKYGGAVFRVDVGVRGLKDFEFLLDPGILSTEAVDRT